MQRLQRVWGCFYIAAIILTFFASERLEGSWMAISLFLGIDAFINYLYKNMNIWKRIAKKRTNFDSGIGYFYVRLMILPLAYCFILFHRFFWSLREVLFTDSERYVDIPWTLLSWDTVVVLVFVFGLFLSSLRLHTHFKTLRKEFPPRAERAAVPEDRTHKYYGLSFWIGALSLLPGYGIILAPIGISLGRSSRRRKAIILSCIGVGVQVLYALLLLILLGE